MKLLILPIQLPFCLLACLFCFLSGGLLWNRSAGYNPKWAASVMYMLYAVMMIVLGLRLGAMR